MIFVAGVAIALFILFLLLSKKNKTIADKILVIWMSVITINLFLFYLMHTEQIYDYPFLLGIDFPIPLLHGILLYFYVGSVTSQLPKQKKILFLHFIPIIAIYVYMISFFMLTTEEKIYIFKNEGIGYEVFMIVLSIAISLSGIVYVIWSNRLLVKHKNNIENRFSSLEKIDLKWLQLLTWGLGAIWIIVVFSEGGPAIYLALVVFIFLIGFFGIKQEKIFSSSTIVEINSTNVTELKKEKYAKSGLKKDTSEQLYIKLIDLMSKESVYKNRELTVGGLASKMEIHPNHLSQLINEREEKNFYDFVNAYRVDEFKKMLQYPENKNITLLALAYDCGFNSKSSFNRCFKKAMGQTPSQYYSSILQA